jgi:hypothetical protein
MALASTTGHGVVLHAFDFAVRHAPLATGRHQSTSENTLCETMTAAMERGQRQGVAAVLDCVDN